MNYVRCTQADPTIFIARILYNTVVEKNKTKAKNAAMLSLGTNRRKKNHLEFEKTVQQTLIGMCFFHLKRDSTPVKSVAVTGGNSRANGPLLVVK